MKRSSYNVILLSVDAMSQVDVSRLMEFPSFRYFTENGVFTDNVTTVFPTITYPIHTSAITGVYPDKHNVCHNEPWQADVPEDLRVWFWGAGEIGAKTLWKAASEKGYRVASLFWPVSGKSTGLIKWCFPEIMPLRGENPVLKYFKYATKWWLAVTELKYGKKVRPSIKRADMDDYVEFLLEKLFEKKHKPQFVSIHFADTDFTRHDYGVGSEQDEEALVRMDRRVQKLIDAVEKNGMKDNTVFVVMSDHGQENVPNGYIGLDEILVNEKLGRAQSVGMGAFIYPKDYDKALEYLKAHKEELHVETILERDELRRMHAPKGVELAVQSASGYGYVDRNCKCDHKGDHGFGVDHPTAKALLWLVGGPFKKGERMEKADIVDIAPTISEILGLNMSCDGKVLKEAMK